MKFRPRPAGALGHPDRRRPRSAGLHAGPPRNAGDGADGASRDGRRPVAGASGPGGLPVRLLRAGAVSTRLRWRRSPPAPPLSDGSATVFATLTVRGETAFRGHALSYALGIGGGPPAAHRRIAALPASRGVGTMRWLTLLIGPLLGVATAAS